MTLADKGVVRAQTNDLFDGAPGQVLNLIQAHEEHLLSIYHPCREVAPRMIDMWRADSQPQAACFAQVDPLTVVAAPVGQHRRHELGWEVGLAPGRAPGDPGV